MTTKELKQRIATILSQVDQNPNIYRRVTKIDPDLSNGSPLAAMIDSIAAAESSELRRQRAPDIFVASQGEFEVHNEQLSFLRILYNQCSPRLKKLFVPILFSLVATENAMLVAHCLMSLGKLSDLSPILKSSLRTTGLIRGILRGIDDKLTVESYAFTDSDLDFVENQIGIVKRTTYKSSKLEELFTEEGKTAIDQELNRLRARIAKVRYLRLKKILMEGENPEINTDKEVLISRLETLPFRTEIADAFRQLDRILYRAGTFLDFKGCMDLIRTIYEEIIEDAAKTAADKTGNAPPDYPKKPFNPWNQYLKSKEILTDVESELTQKLYNYLSEAGSHKLGSAPEQVRVTKNMVIELGLLVVGRLQHIKDGGE